MNDCYENADTDEKLDSFYDMEFTIGFGDKQFTFCVNADSFDAVEQALDNIMKAYQ